MPGSKQRKRIERPREEWQVEHHEALRIIDEALWAQMQERISRSRLSGQRPRRRATGLLTGILVCGTCGTRYVTVNRQRLGCLAHKERGPAVCNQSITVRREVAERELISFVRDELARPEMMDAFVAELLALQAEHAPDPAPIQARIRDAENRITNLMCAIKQGIVTESTKAALTSAERDLSAARADLNALAQREQAGVIDLRLIYRQLVARLEPTEEKAAAREALREILGEVRVKARREGPVAIIDAGQALASMAQVHFNGSGGRI